MIQRIQSVYLLLAGALLAFAICTPIADFKNAQQMTCFTMTAIKYIGKNTTNIPTLPWGVFFLTLIVMLLPIYTIFSFKNRKKQILLCNMNIAVIVFYYITYATYCYSFANSNQLTYVPGFFVILPFVSAVFVALARQAVIKDDRKIREANRIR